MAAPVDPSPPWDAHLPPPLDRGEESWWDDDPDRPKLDDVLGWDELCEDPVEDAEQWAVPGLSGTGDGGSGLSRASVAALAETKASWEALRRAEARCYRSLTALAACDAVGESGYRSTARLLTDHVRIDAAEGLRLARHAP